jgi:hypothetical protein
MSRQRFTLLLIAAIVIISGALFLSGRRSEPQDAPGILLYPGLTAELNSVTTVQLRKGSATPSTTLHKTGDHWTLSERADYPVAVGKLRKLLISLGDAKIVEEKTADPQRFATIGVEDPGATGTAGAEVTVITAKDKHTLIVGKSVGEGNFVRRAGENQSYSVEPAISVETEPRFWIDPRFLDIASSLIQDLEVKPAGGPAYVLHRAKPPATTTPTASPSAASTATPPSPSGAPAAGSPATPAAMSPVASDTAPAGHSEPRTAATTSTTATAAHAPGSSTTGSPPDRAPGDNTFTLDGIPAGRKALDSAALAPSPNTLTSLTVEDVAPASSIDFGQSSQAVVTLTDGTVLTLTGTVAGDKHWIQAKFSKDNALTAKAAGRAFEIASYRYDGIFKPLEQLLVPKPTPPSKTPNILPPTKTRPAPTSMGPAPKSSATSNNKGASAPTSPAAP